MAWTNIIKLYNNVLPIIELRSFNKVTIKDQRRSSSEIDLKCGKFSSGCITLSFSSHSIQFWLWNFLWKLAKCLASSPIHLPIKLITVLAALKLNQTNFVSTIPGSVSELHSCADDDDAGNLVSVRHQLLPTHVSLLQHHWQRVPHREVEAWPSALPLWTPAQLDVGLCWWALTSL